MWLLIILFILAWFFPVLWIVFFGFIIWVIFTASSRRAKRIEPIIVKSLLSGTTIYDKSVQWASYCSYAVSTLWW
ncbi:Uncharacterised protein [Moraxella caviae]|uniref:Uncharacterized protein n=1 Tax=Moraxella caviae TaxID=34060 RepID=A0A378RBS5_9GAMM|nr:Uncharacterised protein [Moraxella caviae]